jgi:hypothetical protein
MKPCAITNRPNIAQTTKKLYKIKYLEGGSKGHMVRGLKSNFKTESNKLKINLYYLF